MTTGLCFWILMLLWLVSGFASFQWPEQKWVGPVGGILQFILFALLGWHVFGPALRG